MVLHMLNNLQVMTGNASKPEKMITIPSNTSNMLGQQTVVIKELRKFTDYNVQVLCFTSKGDGPMSEPVSVKTLEDGMLQLLATQIYFK